MSAQLIIGTIVHNEEAMLQRTFAPMRPFYDGIVAIDACSSDATVAVLSGLGASVQSRPWTGSYADARNACIALAESIHKDAIFLMLDADEAMLSADLGRLRAAMDELGPGKGAALPRYEFVDDLFHFNPVFYPDFQARCFHLHQGFHYGGLIHEQLYFNDEKEIAWKTDRCVSLPYLHLFHYGKCKPIDQVWLKYDNYNRLAVGQPLISSVPPGTTLPASFSYKDRLTFYGERPI